MGKSLYSLILSDEIISEVDRLALRQNLSRSAAVNRILAEYVSMVTPEKRIDSVFRQMQTLFSDSGDLVPFFTPNRTSMSVKSSLEYKYRPTIRYEVSLYREPADSIGELTVAFRTQSQGLLEASTGFFLFFKQLEDAYLNQKAQYSIADGRFTRTLRLRRDRDYTPEQLAGAIARYVRMFDTQLKGYITGGLDARDIEENYRNYLSGAPAVT